MCVSRKWCALLEHLRCLCCASTVVVSLTNHNHKPAAGAHGNGTPARRQQTRGGDFCILPESVRKCATKPHHMFIAGPDTDWEF